jgi:hypothetical protein
VGQSQVKRQAKDVGSGVPERGGDGHSESSGVLQAQAAVDVCLALVEYRGCSNSLWGC